MTFITRQGAKLNKGAVWLTTRLASIVAGKQSKHRLFSSGDNCSSGVLTRPALFASATRDCTSLASQNAHTIRPRLVNFITTRPGFVDRLSRLRLKRFAIKRTHLCVQIYCPTKKIVKFLLIFIDQFVSNKQVWSKELLEIKNWKKWN